MNWIFIFNIRKTKGTINDKLYTRSKVTVIFEGIRELAKLTPESATLKFIILSKIDTARNLMIYSVMSSDTREWVSLKYFWVINFWRPKLLLKIEEGKHLDTKQATQSSRPSVFSPSPHAKKGMQALMLLCAHDPPPSGSTLMLRACAHKSFGSRWN